MRTGTPAALLLLALCNTSCRTTGERAVPIVQPGAPGEATRAISAQAAVDVSRIRHSPADVTFMQGMIGHHAQAIEMTTLLSTRTEREDMRLLARRIEASQADEIALMQRWLEVRGEKIPDAHAHHAAGATLMPGMLSPEDMQRLADARGTAFDRLFLELMIKHHNGALIMVEDLFSHAGAGQEPEIFTFASDVDSDQRIEIERMGSMLSELLR